MKISVLMFSVILTNILFAQNSTVLTINENNYDVSEFNYIYTKNNSNASYNDDTLMSYVQKYFIDYKLKIIEAKRLGYDTLPRLQNELRQYRNQLSRPYLIDKEKNEALIKEAYDRTVTEVRASHILIKVGPQSLPEDTLKAYYKIQGLKKRIIDGESFEALAKQYSDDPSAKSNGGDIGYFTALQMVYPFEEAAYNTEVGSISVPVRTQFGYHIVKVTDKRKSLGKIKASHIMIISNGSEEQEQKSKSKIDEIYKLLKDGGNFEELAQKYSDDQSSNAKGGVLPEFGAGSKQRMVPEFESAAFGIKEDGGYSAPFKTNYGWHIVKRNSVKPVSEYDQLKRELKLKVEKDLRSQKTQQSFINKIKKEYRFRENKSLLAELNAHVSDNVFSGTWKSIDSLLVSRDKELMAFADRSYKLDDFVVYIEGQQRKQKPQLMDAYIESKYKTWVNRLILDYEDTKLEEKHPAFKNLMQEYEEGVLIFEIMQKQVWNKASTDTVGLQKYYEAHKNEFTYNTRYDGSLYKCKDKAIAKTVLKMVKSGALNNQEIQDSLNRDSQLNVNIKKTVFNYNAKEFTGKKEGKFRKFKSGKVKLYQKDGEYYVFNNAKTMPPSIRPFEEAKGLATAGYQNELQKKWLEELRAKADIKVNTEVLYKAETFK